MSTSPPRPTPKINDVFCRDDDHMGRYEASVLWRNVKGDGSWSIMLFSDESFHPIDSTRFSQSTQHTDWRPVEWVWDDAAFMFAPPNVKWDAKKGEWVERPASAGDDAAAPQLPSKSMIPAPAAEEHHTTWRARCLRKFPVLRSEDGAALLGEVWNEHKTKA
jgi:hypothetical protein